MVALEPTREDRQRTALKLLAHHKGREAALSRIKLLTDLLRTELGVAPEAATRALIDVIKRGDFETSHAPDREQPAAQSFVKPLTPATASLSLPAREANMSLVPAPSALATAAPRRETARAALLSWRRQPRAAAWVITASLLFGIFAVLGLADGTKLRLSLTDRQQSQIIAVLPFAADNPGRSDDPAFARMLTHNLIGYLSHFDNLRVMSEQTSSHIEIVRSTQHNSGLIWA